MIERSDTHDLPDQPGVYFFKKGADILYIGKSVNIRTRVQSHIQAAKLSKKEHAIVSQSDNVDAIVTLSNFDAIILESQLIQKHKPTYNVVWKDDKNFLYIKITMGDTYPKIFPVRKEKPEGTSLYFGPFRSSHMTEKLLLELRRIVPFCTQTTLGKRACFYSRIGYCDPCPNMINTISDGEHKKQLTLTYMKNVRKAVRILAGKTQSYTQTLTKSIRELSDHQKYEEALVLRRKLEQFSMFLHQKSFHEGRTGHAVDSESIYQELNQFLIQHFSSQLPNQEYRIECYDMSNLYGKNPTGSMVVFQDGAFAKKEYRIFHVSYQGISDIHMMEEVLTRRLEHSEWRMPDLILLDGGKPQLRHISRLFTSHTISIPLISIAKHPDRILTPRNDFRPVHVDSHSSLFRVIRALRDESHRFAKKHHIILRTKKLHS